VANARPSSAALYDGGVKRGDSSPADRRAHARYNVGFGADVHTAQGVVSAGTRDVSRGGCQLASGRPLDEGVTVRIELCLTIDGFQEPDFPRLTVLGRIQWTTEGQDEDGVVYLSGVRFVDMTGAQGDWLEQLLVQHGAPVEARAPASVDVEVDIDLDD